MRVNRVLGASLQVRKTRILSDFPIADYYLLPSTFSFARTDEGKAMYARYPVFSAWRERTEALPTVRRFRATEAPYGPIEHARKWAVSHRPKY